MITRLIELSIRNKLLVVLLTGIAVVLGASAMLNIRLDAIPDLSDVQVIVITEYPGQAPEVVEDQVTYPLTTAMLSVPGATVVRGFSMFETSMVYVIFKDGTDIYWARARVLEYLNFAGNRLPEGVQPQIGPDATGLGWVYQYVLHPGHYCPEHPQGVFRDAAEDRWYARPEDAPGHARARLEKVRAFDDPGKCPVGGKDLRTSGQDLASLRSLQDWYLRYGLKLDGVAEVASIGGFVKQYQVVLDPLRMRAFGLAMKDVVAAVERSNDDVGGSVIEMSENEYMVRSRGYLRGLEDLGKVAVGLGMGGTPVLLRDVATLQVGGEARRGVGEWNGKGEAVGGIVISRFGENAYKVIRDVKERLRELEPGLPPGVTVKTAYDRSALIERSIETLRTTLIEEIVVVGLLCILFLLHARSELVAIVVVPSGVLVSFLVMYLLGINANIMSLGGIAIAIGVMVDSSVVMVENAHKHLDREEERSAAGLAARPRADVILEAAKEVGPSLFFSLLVITVSFLPVFALGEESGRLFKPLAYTKTFAIAAGALLAVTIVPVLMVYFITSRVLPREWGARRNAAITLAAMALPAAGLALLVPRAFPALDPYRWWIAGGWALLAGMLLIPQRIVHENRNPSSRALQLLYEPFFRLAMRHRFLTLLLAVAALGSAVWPFLRLGSEFMPPLDEGDLLYMPTTDPSISVMKSREVLQQTDRLIASFPEVKSVHGKIGRADTATDPAPLSMIETVVQLHTDPARWRQRKVERFFSGWPSWLKWPFAATFWPEERPITTEELVHGWADADGTMHAGLNQAVKLPGVANAWPFPIENRINMLATGIKTPVGIKFMGPDLAVLSDLAEKAASIARAIPGTVSAYPERTFGGYYLDIEIDRDRIARHGLTVGDVQDVVQAAVGGKNVTETVEGLERYPVNIRYARELRDSVPALEEVLITTPAGAQIPLAEVASIRVNPGPPMVKSENARRTAWVFVDIAGRDLGGYVADARRAVAEGLPLPAGYSVAWSGQFEYAEEANRRLAVVIPITLVLIVLLLYVSTRSWFRVSVILLAVPFSLVGAVWILWLLDYNLSLAVWVGMIALAGLDAETGAVMLLYLDGSFERFRAEGRLRTRADLYDAVHEGAVKRIRPKFITVATDFIGLSPLLWATGTGSDVMRRLAAPMLGGLATSFLMELLVYPVIFYLAKSWSLRKELR
jgi:Cu(I)/Ag(I) efflux system membrane protein CusA/SilA